MIPTDVSKILGKTEIGTQETLDLQAFSFWLDESPK